MNEELKDIIEEMELIEAYNERGRDADRWHELNERKQEIEDELKGEKTMNTYRFRQIAPEHQESPIMKYEVSPYYGVIGVDNDKSGIRWRLEGRYKDIIEALKEDTLPLPIWDDDPIKWTDEEWDDITKGVMEAIPPYGRLDYTRMEAYRILILAEKPDASNIAEIFNIMEGRTDWSWKELHGAVQGEWLGVVYDSKYIGADGLREIESEYFNLGTEWINMDDGEHIYVQSDPTWEPDKVRADIIENMSEEFMEGDKLVLESFSGWIMIPSYTLI